MKDEHAKIYGHLKVIIILVKYVCRGAEIKVGEHLIFQLTSDEDMRLTLYLLVAAFTLTG